MRCLAEFIFASVLLVGPCGCANKAAAPHSPEVVPVAQSDPVGKRTVLRYLAAALGPKRGDCRLYYRGIYKLENASAVGTFLVPRVAFPAIPVQYPPKGASGIAAIRAIFRGDRDVVVRQGVDGTISVYIGKVSLGPERLKLQSFAFTQDERYSAALAILEITDMAQTSSAMRKHDFHEAGGLIDIITSGPDPSRPHLPERMTNVTMRQALDKVAKVFGVIIWYGECSDPHGGTMFDVWYQ